MARAVADALNLPPALGRLLAARGILAAEDARRFLRPLLEHLAVPGLLADADRAVARIRRALDAGETILVHGDYDVDGICSAALLTRVLRRLGGHVVPFVPHRVRDGYDLGATGIRTATEAGATLIVTADSGILAHAAVADAAAAGIDVVVTDHHTPGATLPPAVAVVNPNRADCEYPFKGLCGAGVAWTLCRALAEGTGLADEDLAWYLDLVALATVADLVPLADENRVLVRIGLRALERTRNPGLRALLEVSGLADGPVESGKVGFVLAPRINAMGRMGDAAEALRLLLTEDAAEAAELARRLDEQNRIRQGEDRRTLEEALDLLARDYDPTRDYGVVLAREGWHPGVIGIVASRVVERIHRPAVLVALDGDRGRGSARSVPGFHLHRALTDCAGHLGRWGGHAQAAGMDVGAADVAPFREAFNARARSELEGRDLRPTLRVDLELALGEADLALVDLLRWVGPHGIGNPRPVFLVRGAELAGPARVVGKGHLRLRLGGGKGSAGTPIVDAIGFGLAERHAPDALPDGPLDVAVQLMDDDWSGRRRLKAKVLDLRPAEPADGHPA
ncbi:MAG: single-stranded-DNA-specific exonuclease RecJ [Gemmatimonadetes bacterium]|nr:single-stranded-DNA-specific exonuclease RecJ [Gemmatimonadota bacterium]